MSGTSSAYVWHPQCTDRNLSVLWPHLTTPECNIHTNWYPIAALHYSRGLVISRNPPVPANKQIAHHPSHSEKSAYYPSSKCVGQLQQRQV